MNIVPIHGELTELIEKACRQDRLAQKQIYLQYAPRLLSICRQYLTDQYTAEDMMVTAFMKIFTHLSSYQFKGNFEAWMRRIAINECLSFIRAHHSQLYQDFDQDVADAVCIDDVLNMEDIQNLIDMLPKGCKMVFMLYAVEGYKHHEIAAMLDITEGTSKSQLAYARKLLQTWFHQYKMVENG